MCINVSNGIAALGAKGSGLLLVAVVVASQLAVWVLLSQSPMWVVCFLAFPSFFLPLSIFLPSSFFSSCLHPSSGLHHSSASDLSILLGLLLVSFILLLLLLLLSIMLGLLCVNALDIILYLGIIELYEKYHEYQRWYPCHWVCWYHHGSTLLGRAMGLVGWLVCLA